MPDASQPPRRISGAIELRELSSLKPYKRNARVHPKKQVDQIVASIGSIGFLNPVLITADLEIVAGHARVLAAKRLGWTDIRTLTLPPLTPAERRAYVLADNKIAMNAGWDIDLLASEVQALLDDGFDARIAGFSATEIDVILDASRERADEELGEPEDRVPELGTVAVSRPGDIWTLGRHRLICGDAQSYRVLADLMDGKIADIIFTDPPYNVKIDGNVTGLGKIRHREFAMASEGLCQLKCTRSTGRAVGWRNAPPPQAC